MATAMPYRRQYMRKAQGPEKGLVDIPEVASYLDPKSFLARLTWPLLDKEYRERTARVSWPKLMKQAKAGTADVMIDEPVAPAMTRIDLKDAIGKLLSRRVLHFGTQAAHTGPGSMGILVPQMERAMKIGEKLPKPLVRSLEEISSMPQLNQLIDAEGMYLRPGFPLMGRLYTGEEAVVINAPGAWFNPHTGVNISKVLAHELGGHHGVQGLRAVASQVPKYRKYKRGMEAFDRQTMVSNIAKKAGEHFLERIAREFGEATPMGLGFPSQGLADDFSDLLNKVSAAYRRNPEEYLSRAVERKFPAKSWKEAMTYALGHTAGKMKSSRKATTDLIKKLEEIESTYPPMMFSGP